MKILVLAGDHIGPEITPATVAVLEAADRRFGLGLEFAFMEVGLVALAREGTTLPGSVVEAARAADGVVLGPCANASYPPREEGGINVPGELRRLLDLYANVRPCRSRPFLADARPGMDLVFVRENTEGFYPDRNMHLGAGEFMPTPEVALSMRKITAAGSRRIARAACEIARRRRGRVTAVTKRAPLPLSDGLFWSEVNKAAAEFPEVVVDEVIVDALAALLYRDPARFDVLVATNMFGDILGNAAAEMSGGLGLAPGLNAGDRHAAANAAHGSAPDIAGQDKANPTALILSAAMLLDWLGGRHGRADLAAAARAVERSVDGALADPGNRTPDLGGRLGTRAFGEAVAARIGGA
ncbi:MAG: isocitrate/isopropylmalate dehydrogenase family protein [Proteobacteria bacterium]|nr:isocitrate/isopropylmalate dehydrogenase family protein [Pseudomonadota bacterium]